MKTKLFAVALAAVALVGMTACEKPNQPDEETLTLSEQSITLSVGETKQLTANVAVDKWESNKPEVATVADGTVTAEAEGNAIITATTKAGSTATCIVLVKKADEPGTGGDKTVKGSEIYPIILDATTFEANAGKVKGDFRIDDATNFLYIWANGETYVAGEGTGKNFYGNTEGYVSLTVAAPAGWSGLGISLGETSAAAAETLRQTIVADQDSYFLHIAIKATTQGNHQFYTFNTAETSFNIGTAAIEKGPVVGDFTRDGSWAEFDIPMSQFATALAAETFPKGGNIFCVLSGGSVGSQLNLDAVYFYKK